MRVMNFSFAMLEKSHAELLELCKQADLVIVSHTAAGSMEADQLGMPRVSVTLMPEAIPARNPKDSWIKKSMMNLAGAGMGLLMTRPLNRIRRRLGLPRMGPTGITSPVLNLIPVSPHVVPPNPLWEERHQMTGYWYAPSPEDYQPPAELVEFLEDGGAPVVISLGAMALSGEDAFEGAHTTVDAVQEARVRAIIQGWDEPMKSIKLPSSIFHAGSVPHTWLLGQASAIVHHGGFGSTAAGLRAGIPSLVIPHIIDQFLWGQKISQLGVGPKPIPRPKLAVQNLATALTQMHTDPDMRQTARSLGENIRREQGTETAVRLILKEFAQT
jgi:UDP:flavonoid glycosyltransferase YjiC (YdhE family)